MLTSDDKKFMLMIVKRYKEAKARKHKHVYYSVRSCRRLEALMGKTENELRAWDLVRKEFRAAYPCELRNIRDAIKTVKKRMENIDV